MNQIPLRHTPCAVGLLKEARTAGGKTMPKRKKRPFKMPEKTCWHLYSLQNLNAEKFVRVVSKILKRQHLLIK
jgi:hypothetical protein